MSRKPALDPLVVSSEWNLILACARTRLDDSHRLRIRDLLTGRLEWVDLIALAARHRVESLLYMHLDAEFAASVPAEVLAGLKETAHDRGRSNLRLTGQMFGLIELFEKTGIVTVPYKGPALGSLAYGNFALRYSEDLDFVLPQREVLRASSLLLGAGFRASVDPSIARHARFLERGDLGQYLFFGAAGASMVELHTEKTLRYFPVPLDWDGLRERLETISVSGRLVRTFCAEDLLVLLSVHGAKHFWSRLSWICDIAELSQVSRGLDWDLSESLARRMGCRRMWLMGLSLAYRMLDAPLPPLVLGWIERDPGVIALSQHIQALSGHQNEAQLSLARRLHFRIRSHETVAGGLRQCVRVATRLTEDDWSGFALPEWAELFYTVLRPWRLLYKHSFRLHHRSTPRLDPHFAKPRDISGS